jgi:hypothetical protein
VCVRVSMGTCVWMCVPVRVPLPHQCPHLALGDEAAHEVGQPPRVRNLRHLDHGQVVAHTIADKDNTRIHTRMHFRAGVEGNQEFSATEGNTVYER